jgi:phosphoribosyl 1,2-cyclic phosphodiesterase
MKPDPEQPLAVTLWGTRGSVATPGTATIEYGGNTPCVQVASARGQVILDAGTGIRPLGKKLVRDADAREHHIFLSHTHWDHIQGIPFFQPAYEKHHHIHFYGSPRNERFLENILTGQMNLSYFPVQMKDLPAQLHFHELHQSPISIADMSISFEEQIYHPGGSLRFRITAGGRSMVYATDVEIDGIRNAPSPYAGSRPLCRVPAVCGRCGPVIADAQYSRKEYAAKTGWGHSSLETVIETARQARVKRLALFHHDPDHTDDILKAMGKSEADTPASMQIFPAQEGTTILL